MADSHTSPCQHTQRIADIEKSIGLVTRTQGIALARLGMDQDGVKVGNGHTVLGRLEAAEDRGEKLSGEVRTVRGAMVSKDDVQAIIDAAVAKAVTARGNLKTGRISAWAPYVAAFVALVLGILGAVR